MTLPTLNSLWGEEFTIESNKKKTSDIIEQVSTPKEINFKKVLDSKKLTIPEKVEIIDREVHRVLGNFIDDTVVIRDKEELVKYIDRAIQNDVIAIDTETNNSLDYLTCKLMGACIYTPSMKQAYIPINHKDFYTDELLAHQLTEKDIEEQFNRLIENKTKIIMHNGKFDYQVLKCTCNLELPIYWDTMIASHLIDEDDSHKLKDLYVKLIDKSQEKYSIESLFGSVPYAYLPPEVFAPYSAGDAFETYKLYLWQVDYFNLDENKSMLKLLFEVEMPILKVVAEMELTGIEIDLDYVERLKAKYIPMREEIEEEINKQLIELQSQVDEWKKTSDARTLVGNKMKLEQLSNPIKVSSPTQLAILFYDVLKVTDIESSNGRGTGEDQLKEIESKYHFPICSSILKYREINKMLDTYIEKLPKEIRKDGRVHCSFNQLGTVTGRFSSSDPNLQNIPSHNLEIRMLFKASDDESFVNIENDYFEVSIWDKIETKDGWKSVNDLRTGDILIGDNNLEKLDRIVIEDKRCKIFTSNCFNN